MIPLSRRWRVAGLMAGIACVASSAVQAGQAQALQAVLQSNKSWREKEAAVVALHGKATPDVVPALAPLLADEKLSHAARHVLEPMACPEAGQALVAALGKTGGRVQAGIIDSLGDRREARAVAALVKLVGSGDALIASSAAVALGKIGGAEAVAALRATLPKASAAVRPAVADALLTVAEREPAAEALALCKEVYAAGDAMHIRAAAFRRMLLVAGDNTGALATQALKGDEAAARAATLRLVQEQAGKGVTAALLPNLAQLPAPSQIAVLSGVAAHGGGQVRAVLPAAKSENPGVRLAAIRALAEVGDASAVPVLASAAATGSDEQREAARAALARLHRGDVRGAMLKHLAEAQPAEQSELAEALGRRRDTGAVPDLLKRARQADAAVQVVCLRAIGLLGDGSVAGDLTGFVVQTNSDAVRSAAGAALVAVAARSKAPQTVAGGVLAAAKGASIPARCELLRAAGRIGGKRAADALRAGSGDADASVRDACIRTMAEAGGVDLALDLLGLATTAARPVHKVLALRGYWRVVQQTATVLGPQRVAMCERGMAAAARVEEKRLGLSVLSGVAHMDAMELARKLAADATIRAEAESAEAQIASALAKMHPAAARAALERLTAGASTDAVRSQASSALAAMDKHRGYARIWQVAGPYREDGKKCQQLFDVALPPEKPDAKVEWKSMDLAPEPRVENSVDLAKVVNGNHCVAYLKGRVFAPKAQRVKLEIGSDDGIKIWVNGKLVHASNAVRGLAAAQEIAHADLKQGWNDVLVKITQHTAGCGACIRVCKPDGGVPEGLRFDNGAGQ